MEFRIEIGDDVLDDLRDRIGRTRWPGQIPGIGWRQGTELGYLRELLAYWADGFDWRAQEAWLNSFTHHVVDDIHFVHARAADGKGIPLILTHGWPSCFAEYLSLVPLLTDPAAHGIHGPSFDLVIPSLPGYGFSARPLRAGVNYRDVARRWHGLMRGLGYSRYAAGGGDFGAGAATFMAVDDPGSMIGIHLTNPELTPQTDGLTLTPSERAYLDAVAAWDAAERGYSAIQSTKPQTVGYGVTDSPAGLAAWILEKWYSWTDSGGDLDRRFGRDFLLTMLTVYWATGSITTSMRDYWDNRWHAVRPDFVTVPTAFALFPNGFVPEAEPPREFMQRLYDIRRWTVLPRGGHFAPAEEPELVARDIAAFFAELA